MDQFFLKVITCIFRNGKEWLLFCCFLIFWNQRSIHCNLKHRSLMKRSVRKEKKTWNPASYLTLTLVGVHFFCKSYFMNFRKNNFILSVNHIYLEEVARRCSVKKVFLKISQNCEKFQNLWLRPATLLKKRLWHRYFPVNFVKFLRTPFL